METVVVDPRVPRPVGSRLVLARRTLQMLVRAGDLVARTGRMVLARRAVLTERLDLCVGTSVDGVESTRHRADAVWGAWAPEI